MASETLKSSPARSPAATRVVPGPIEPSVRFERVVLSWNPHLPVRGRLSVGVRVKAVALRWSCWFTAGTWPPSTYRISDRDSLYGRLDVDELRLRRPCTKVQYSVELRDGARIPARVFIASSPAVQEPDEHPPPEIPPLVVPFYSQFSDEDLPDEAVQKAGGCGPTSVAMVVRYYGVDVGPLDMARLCHDPLHDIYGNWSYLACGAATFGLEAWVTRIASWDELGSFLRHGIPPVLSLAWKQGELSNAPVPASNGHLLVVAGLGRNGVTCYDPAAKQAPVAYDWWEFGKIFWGHGGVAIIIKRP